MTHNIKIKLRTGKTETLHWREGLFRVPVEYRRTITEVLDWGGYKPTSLRSAFVGCWWLTSVGDLDVSSVTNMRSMFGCAYHFNQGISHWDVSSVADMRFMFRDCPLGEV